MRDRSGCGYNRARAVAAIQLLDLEDSGACAVFGFLDLCPVKLDLVADLARPHTSGFENALEHALAGVVEDDLPAVRAFTPDQREYTVVFLGFALGGSF